MSQPLAQLRQKLGNNASGGIRFQLFAKILAAGVPSRGNFYLIRMDDGVLDGGCETVADLK
jgi:hypothetical protein